MGSLKIVCEGNTMEENGGEYRISGKPNTFVKQANQDRMQR